MNPIHPMAEFWAEAERLDPKGFAKARAEHERVEELRIDADRYRWLRAEHERHDPICHLSWKRNGDRNSGEWVNTARLDASIDLAISAARELGNA